jgi:hypothetical protein
MLLPNADQAEIDIRKLRDYVLNPLHANGKHKAVIWKSALGITAVDAEELREVLLIAVMENEAVPGRFDKYGQRYTVDLSLMWKDKSAIIRTGWIIEHGTDTPRLTTAYPR